MPLTKSLCWSIGEFKMWKLRFYLVGLLTILQFSSLVAGDKHFLQSNTREEHLKAVFILNFTQFIEWPSSNWKTDDDPLIINVLGDKSFGNFLRKVVKGEMKGTHPIVVLDVNSIEDLTFSHILFIGKNYDNDLNEVFSRVNTTGTLTVSDTKDFAERGGIIRFYLENGKMRIQINRTAALIGELQISAKLLSVAQIITPDIR